MEKLCPPSLLCLALTRRGLPAPDRPCEMLSDPMVPTLPIPDTFSEYDFFNFNTMAGSGNLNVTVLLAPAFNSATESKPIAFGITIDSQPVKTVNPIGRLAKPGDYPAGWGSDFGWVANAITPSVTNVNGVTPGAHTLKVGEFTYVTIAADTDVLVLDLRHYLRRCYPEDCHW